MEFLLNFIAVANRGNMEDGAASLSCKQTRQTYLRQNTTAFSKEICIIQIQHLPGHKIINLKSEMHPMKDLEVYVWLLYS